ncbi:hypothetical protein ACWN8B_00160 [Vagococcus zengguangii]|uniref:Uncharacterized protein n=1 Tax=Vagococcus zengguangii TaxID=2571750 RepID=A0A4D7CTS6_9ENTE|nr:hypothetical protein [Vagococcus zengguangii]QCI86332.1 hypothetical protein FA707_04845 [Vagococcus zengguangii]
MLKKINHILICSTLLIIGTGCSKKSEIKNDSSLKTHVTGNTKKSTNSNETDQSTNFSSQEKESNSSKEKVSTTIETTSEASSNIPSTEEILSNDNPEKFIQAYNEFSMNGNPMPPEQRGSVRPSDSSGLSGEEYNIILWGIVDYYGNAYQNGWISEEQNSTAQKLATDKLYNGGYSDQSNNDDLVNITSENVIEYVDEYVRTYTDWNLSYPEVKLADDGISLQVHFESELGSPNRGYFLVSPHGTIARYSTVGEPLKRLEDL